MEDNISFLEKIVKNLKIFGSDPLLIRLIQDKIDLFKNKVEEPDNLEIIKQIEKTNELLGFYIKPC